MRQRIGKPTKSLHHGGSSVNVDRFDILIRPHGASVSLARSAGHLGQGQGYRGELQGSDGCSGNAGGLQLLASHPASLGRLPEGRIGWVAPMLSQSILLSRWMKCGSGGGSGPSFLWPLPHHPLPFIEDTLLLPVYGSQAQSWCLLPVA